MAVKGRPRREVRTIVFVSFETGFAPSGGLGAVMKLLPREMAKRERCYVVAPHFAKITGAVPQVASCHVPLQGGQVPVGIHHATAAGVDTYLLSAEGFFTAAVDPYVNPRDPHAPVDPYVNPIVPEKLIEDALFFSAAVPPALEALAEVGLLPKSDLILHLQDWETACVAQAVRRWAILERAACILTLHNPYDRYLGPADSPRVRDLISTLSLTHDNVLAQMIPLTDGPVSTVSQNFAEELTLDPLHTQVFARHLQHLLVGQGVVGIDNGLFGEARFPFSEKAEEQARTGDWRGLQQEKWARRGKLGAVLAAYQQELARAGSSADEDWGEDLDLLDPGLPVFLILGRDDPRQKGYDVVAEAIRRIPQGRARYVFTPMPGDEGLLGLGFLQRLAQERPGEVRVFPFRLAPAPFEALKEGSSFMVMGSLYEPFGAATEAYLAGMPVVARATGGLAQQVAPWPSPALSREGWRLAAPFHGPLAEPTGFLYREPAVPDAVGDWQHLVACAYWQIPVKGDRIEDRRGVPLFEAMVQRAAWALQDAIDLYQRDQLGYARMIFHGTRKLASFGWDRAVQGYRQLYDRVCA
jgi:glycogen synthase